MQRKCNSRADVDAAATFVAADVNDDVNDNNINVNNFDVNDDNIDVNDDDDAKRRKRFPRKENKRKNAPAENFSLPILKNAKHPKVFRACNFVFLSFCKIFAKGNKNNMSDAQTSFENPGSTMGSPPLTNFREKSAIWTCFEHR